jgi:hypothetical protein
MRKTGFSSLTACCLVSALLADKAACAAEHLELEVRETAGIQRFGYPLSVRLMLPDSLAADTRFRLTDAGRRVRAQITPPVERARRVLGARVAPTEEQFWWLDFAIDLVPNETRRVVLEYGEGIPADPQSQRRSLQVEQTDGTTRVKSSALEFVMPAKVDGLFDSVLVSGDRWLAGRAAGMTIETRDGKSIPLADLARDVPVRVIKPGPLAAAVQSSGSGTVGQLKSVGWSIRLDFPLGKSWSKVDLAVDDPDDFVQALAGELRLRLGSDGKPPVMADVGAAGWTYAALSPGDSLRYRASPSEWMVERFRSGKASPYVVPPKGGHALAPHGWAHLMDMKRATAIAMADFANQTTDTIELGADGKVRLARQFPQGWKPSEKRLTFWLHVVSSPPQWGAATSPQSMLAPPEVRVVNAPPEPSP